MFVVLIVGCSAPAPTPVRGTPAPNSSDAIVTAKGAVVPSHYARIAFSIGGTVSKLAVKEGDPVKAGDLLAQLDTRDLDFQVKAAQDALELAQATLAQTQTPAAAEEITAAQAAYDSAVAALSRARRGPDPQEIAAAQAAYDSAVAGLNRARRGPDAQEIAAAQAAYDSAVAALNRARNGPTPEELAILKAQLQKAKAALDQAQAAYDRAGGSSNPLAGMLPTSLALQAATQDYQIAQANYDKATKIDPATIAQAQAAVAQAQATLTLKKQGPRAEDIQQAEAAVRQAQANLDAKKNGARPEDIQQAEAAVRQAQANLDLKKKGARPQDIAVAQARVKQAQTALDQAQAALAKARLVAPFGGVVTNLSVREGETIQPGAPIVTVADLSELRIETTDLDEFGAAKVKLGQSAKITVNAFTDKTLSAKVTNIANQSVTLSNGDISYVVTLALDKQDPDLRWGMTVKVEFQK